MNLQCYPHDDGYRVVAENDHGGRAETVFAADHPVSEYVTRKHRLNREYVVYWLTELGDDPDFLAFLNTANDHFRERRVRSEGWQDTAGLSTGEVPSKPQKPGDVVVHGHHATATLRITRD